MSDTGLRRTQFYTQVLFVLKLLDGVEGPGIVRNVLEGEASAWIRILRQC